MLHNMVEDLDNLQWKIEIFKNQNIEGFGRSSSWDFILSWRRTKYSYISIRLVMFQYIKLWLFIRKNFRDFFCKNRTISKTIIFI